MDWILFAEIFYVIIIIWVCARVIDDTQSTTKTLAYLLFVIFVPFVGVIVYFSFGINYRKRKIYSKKIFNNEEKEREIEKQVRALSKSIFTAADESVVHFRKLSALILNQSLSPITEGNKVLLLLNGENKFPKVFNDIKNAKDHIHIEYYIFDADVIGCQLIDLLIEKAREGVKVRFVYDDFGSREIRKKQVSRLKEAGVAAYPFYKIKLIALANRINYRNHRKIIVVDGRIGYVGGINVSDRYINREADEDKLYWRDTHLRLEGPAVSMLQYVFLGDWNYCSGEQLLPKDNFFPFSGGVPSNTGKIVQLVASGPDSDSPLIQQSLMQAINLAKREILITTPYFIPGDALMESLIVAAWSGTRIKLLVPGTSDSLFVNFAARSNYGKLLKAGAEVYRYQKGFVHSKTMVIDGELAIVGTANMDLRSFDLNFEVNAIVYDKEIAAQLCNAFFEDIKESTRLNAVDWKNRKGIVPLLEKIAALFSPMM